jgi:hypothetical protein
LKLTDSLGFLILDEVTGLQDGYDTVLGLKLIQKAIFKEANHP